MSFRLLAYAPRALNRMPRVCSPLLLAIQSNRTGTGSTTPLSQTATIPASGTDITVTDGSKFVVDLPVVFSSSGSGLYQYQTYFIQYVSGNTIRVAHTMGGSAISLNSSRTSTIVCYPDGVAADVLDEIGLVLVQPGAG